MKNPTFTRKHYEFLADRIYSIRVGIERHGDSVLNATFQNWVDYFIYYFKEDNPRFNESEFKKACGIE